MLPKRPRIKGFPYTGFHRYSLTICTHRRNPYFVNAAVVSLVLSKIRQCGPAYNFAVFTYCFMPDHVHLIVTATSEAADLRKFVSMMKQVAGHAHKCTTGSPLWQPSYYDHVLRNDEETAKAVRYVLENPVRRGLVTEFAEYPFCGSDVFDMEQLKDFWHDRQG
jgi:putative transposase